MLDFIAAHKYKAKAIEFNQSDRVPLLDVVFYVTLTMTLVVVYSEQSGKTYVFPITSVFRFCDVEEYYSY